MTSLLAMHTRPQDWMSGRKARTSRLKKPGDKLVLSPRRRRVVSGKNVTKWQVGREIPVRLSRTGKTHFRIVCQGLDEADIRASTLADAVEEGCETLREWLCLWVSIHDKCAHECLQDEALWTIGGKPTYACLAYLWARPTEKYNVWVIYFLPKEANSEVPIVSTVDHSA